MKLVELLARELSEWPNEMWSAIGQASDGDLHAEPFSGRYLKLGISVAEDHMQAIVSRNEWQAERDRQKGGQWKRHRGNSQPVDEGTWVEVKLRCGDIQQGLANAFLWRHADCDVAANIMKYRVISQPQAEGVEYRGPFPCAPIGETVNAMEFDIEFPSGTCFVEAKTEQMETPFKWRDEVTELNAYIEKFTREREALINRLALEGFALIPAMTAVMGVVDVKGAEVSGWRSWNAGDEIECIFSECNNIYTVGNVYTVNKVEEDYAVVTDDTCYGGGTCHINDDDLSDVRFVRCQ